jgi:hypothetical protein
LARGQCWAFSPWSWARPHLPAACVASCGLNFASSKSCGLGWHDLAGWSTTGVRVTSAGVLSPFNCAACSFLCWPCCVPFTCAAWELLHSFLVHACGGKRRLLLLGDLYWRLFVV